MHRERGISREGLSPEFVKKEKEVSQLLLRAREAEVKKEYDAFHQCMQMAGEMEHELSQDLEEQLQKNPQLLLKYVSHALSAASCSAYSNRALSLKICENIHSHTKTKPVLSAEISRVKQHIERIGGKKKKKKKAVDIPNGAEIIVAGETICAEKPSFIPPRTSIFTQLVIDSIIHVRVPHESATLNRAMRWDSQKNIIINQGAKISAPQMSGQPGRLLFTPVSGHYRSGEKILAESIKTVPWNEDGKENQHLARLGYVRQAPGGGGINVGYALYNLFRGIDAQLHGVYTEIKDDTIESALKPIFQGGLEDLRKVNPCPAVNLIIEGISNDRLIIKSPQPMDINIEPHKVRPNSFIMVNSNYNVYSSADGLVHLLESKQGGIVACTMSLCNKEPLNRDLRKNVEERLAKAFGNNNSPKFNSILDFLRHFIMPQSDKITYVFNETELNNFACENGETLFRVPDKAVLFGNVIRALCKLRRFQRGKKPTIFVTLGSDGALCLDREDRLHHCRVATSEEVQKAPRERNAIGDLFAGTLLGLYVGGAYEKKTPIVVNGEPVAESSTPRVLITACAACDAGIYDGFTQVDPPGLDRMISLKIEKNHYAYIGNIEDFRHKLDRVEGADVSYVVSNLMQLESVVPNGLLKGRVRGGFGLTTLVDPQYVTFPDII